MDTPFRETLHPVNLALLVLVAIYTFLNKSLGMHHRPRITERHVRLPAVLVGSVFGFQEGFFGLGTGAFLIFVFLRVFG